ncbi:DNA alkylation repair protein [Aquibacillus koreensis]|uniref:DNA alkylation repair protein n=1 Tax=Aquibacillus koreensis TaxID=279446 RepID=A0A9X3WPI9_9BACI|nr:DNA alkylation repair protein [Aquibacillus koreensis]MCT2535220.1 DNA alkylation repair protein [Aquibacillus koreensis]MDC3421079.1 DNA alkylation repair protein [Aquibacillus koreensis]
MAEALKDIYNENFLHGFAKKVHIAYPPFHSSTFVKDVMDHTWSHLELKQRIRQITLTLGRHLPTDYAQALDVLYQIDEECQGFPYLFFPDFVEVFGQTEDNWDLSMDALKRFTSKSSSEFAIRPFLIREPERTIEVMKSWAKNPNEHVRRLASEGCRPRLPWGQALPMFKKDPTLPLSILEMLKEDPATYVQKSVANHLNDIAKDNPSTVIETAYRWKGISSQTDWIIRHGCRTLIRKADPDVLALFGYTKIKQAKDLFSHISFSINPSDLEIGETTEIHYELDVHEGDPVTIRLEYAIDFIKSRGQTSRKIFLLSNREVSGGNKISNRRKHSWKDLSTRKHYKGPHRIVLLANGVEVAEDVVELK